MTDPNLFTYKMRKATRKIHAVSDALVNAKLAMSLNSDSVWAEGLLVFYEIFKFLEQAMTETKNENLRNLLIDGMARTDSFERDLNYYLGKDWKKTYNIRDSVALYLKHLKALRENDSDMLIAYVYHLYMGLLSGGQILRKKRELKNKLFSNDQKSPGEAVTDFGEINISDLKNELKNLINSAAETWDDEKKIRIINEGNKVFELNNMIIRSISSTNKVLVERALIFGFGLAFLIILYNILLS